MMRKSARYYEYVISALCDRVTLMDAHLTAKDPDIEGALEYAELPAGWRFCPEDECESQRWVRLPHRHTTMPPGKRFRVRGV